MAFDFLPDEQVPEPKPNTEEAGGGQFSVGKNVFFDDYKHHLDAHALFSILPAVKDEWNLSNNFTWIKDRFFSEETLMDHVTKNFYGPGTEIAKLKEGYTSFQNPEKLKKIMGEIDDEIPADLFSAIEKPKMKINDRFGMFSFDLASMAMIYVYDYYTLKGEKKVDSSFVQKSTSKFIYLPTKEEVRQEIRRRKDGTPVVVSSVRNSLIDFEKKDKQDRSVEIMILNSFAYRETVDNVIYNSMAAISVAKNLLLKGFRVKLTSVIAVRGDTDKIYHHFIPAKRFNQPLDLNAAAYVCGDPRFFRFQGFKIIASGYDRDNEKIPSGLGTIQNNVKALSLAVEKDYVPNSELKQADARLYFGGSRDILEVKQEVQTAIEILNAKYGEKQ